jgi:hypothetical protein
MPEVCSIEGCNFEGKLRRGLCGKHYMRLRRSGNALGVREGKTKTYLSKHPLYTAWSGMVNRCTNPNNSSYGRYGGRGITVCERWRTFANFLADMGERPPGKTLDRIDPRGPYSPENCRWADKIEQRANISRAGDKRMREAMSVGVKRYWEKWRMERGLPPHAPTRAEYRARNRNRG